MSLLALSTLALLNLACTAEEEAGGMGGGGIANDINQPNTGNGQQGEDDTGTYGSAPAITGGEGLWNENAEGQWQILVSINYTDDDNDVDGGQVGMSAEVAGVMSPEQWFMIDGNQAIHDAEAGLIDVTILLEQVEASPDDGSVNLMVRLRDANGNVSNEYSITPYSE